MFLDWAMVESLTVLTHSRIFEMFVRRTIMRKDAGELYKAFCHKTVTRQGRLSHD